MIQLNALNKTYSQKNSYFQALNNIDLHISEGEVFGIVGKSGAGKSTLLRCMNLLEVPTTGDVIVANQNLTQLSRKELRLARQNIGMIFQHFNLLDSRNVFQNIALPLEITNKDKNEIKGRVEYLLEVTGLETKSQHYPAQLSGGQKQRVAIARALATNPKVLLCDEATSALDLETSKSILDLLREINKKFKVTIVLITHEIWGVKYLCDRVAILENGKILSIGHPAQIKGATLVFH